jgi:hypothetical protein
MCSNVLYFQKFFRERARTDERRSGEKRVKLPTLGTKNTQEFPNIMRKKRKWAYCPLPGITPTSL